MIYLGVTAVSTTPKKALLRRWQKHVSRSKTEDKSWKLCEAIRLHGAEAFTLEVVEVVRGKQNAHVRERELIRVIKPKLNTDIRAKKLCA